MQKAPLVLAGLVLPISVLALTYTDQTDRYTDAPFNSAESAGISVLTELGAVEGNPDGTFHPERTLNRAEFLKIVFLSNPNIRVSPSDADACFPDVAASDWFSRYVCLAKKRAMVEGYPDGLFHPEREVNYVEALKILVEVYTKFQDCPFNSCSGHSNNDPSVPWYEYYVNTARSADLLLPSLSLDAFLTRGQMARLAASFYAYSNGELTQYRDFEKGLSPRSSRSSSSAAPRSSSSMSAGSSVSSSASSASSSASMSVILPAVSHLLLLGELTQPLASGLFVPPNNEAGTVTFSYIETFKELKSIEEFYVIDSKGKRILTLVPDIYDSEDLKWKAVSAASGHVIPAGGEVLALTARIKDRGTVAFAEELINVKKWFVTVENPARVSYELPPTNGSLPSHQTVQALLHTVESAGPAGGVLQTGNGLEVASFKFSGTVPTDTSLRVENLSLTPSLTSGVTASHWRLIRDGSPDSHSCSVSAGGTVECSGIPSDLGMLVGTTKTIRLLADVQVSGNGQTFQLILQEPGSTSVFGAVQWTDGSGHYRWVDLPAPVAKGTLWKN